MRTIDRGSFGPAVRDGSGNSKLYLARRVQQRTAMSRCRCYRREGTYGVRLTEAKNAATAATAATATTDLDAELARETGSSTDHDAGRTRNSGRSSNDLEINKIRQQAIGFKRMRDDGLITDDEFEAKKEAAA